MKSFISRAALLIFPMLYLPGSFDGQLTRRALLPEKISESSGLIFSDGKLWTHNDKGGLPCIYSIDTGDAHIKQTVFIDNFPNVDWEDITADKDHIYVCDFGNNFGNRKNLRILVIDKSDLSNDPVIHVSAKAISFSYADQKFFQPYARNNFDCESVLSIGDSLYLFSKDRGDNMTRVYRLPKTPGTYKIQPYTHFNVAGRICGASFNANTNQLVLVGYMAYTVHSFLWMLKDFSGDDFFGGTKERIEIGTHKLRWKTEGISWIDDDRIFISNERSPDEPAALYIYTPKK